MRTHAVIALLALFGLTSGGAGAAADMPTIFIASDSTATIYPASAYPQMGWGMVLECALDRQVRVNDMAQGGRSARSFRKEGWLSKIELAARPGDVLLIQFGHNDAARTLEGRYTPVPAFKEELAAYVATAHLHDMTPILLTPVSKGQFANGLLQNGLAEYAQAVRDVAAETKTRLIDLNALSQAALMATGPEGAKPLYMPDSIHLTERGARLAASLVALGLANQQLPVSAHVRLSTIATSALLGGPGCPAG